MKYKIYSKNRRSHWIDIECIIENIDSDELIVSLPAWRPGRYELQNFAKNIQSFHVFDQNNEKIPFEKITKDTWKIQAKGTQLVIVRYNYYSSAINAGSSFVDEQTLYINPVNLCLYRPEKIREKCSISIDIRENEQIAGIQSIEDVDNQTKILHFDDFYHLADSPFIISKNLTHDSFEINDTTFHLWFEGNFNIPNLSQITDDFRKFATKQIELFGEFPEKVFHFITWLFPNHKYHGVEHRSSTMQTLGPFIENSQDFLVDLYGLSSHELFHAWNICKIRPKELLPYDYSKENYFKTCFVAEGLTTYYGDLMLYRSGVFDYEQYLRELETYYKRHFDEADGASQSLLESSWDLWLDGYSSSIPKRKVSVYHKGAIAGQILDLHIQRISNKQRSLDDVMRKMWKKFGKSVNGHPLVGYSLEDYISICEEVAGEKLEWYFETCIAGTDSLFGLLNEYLKDIGLSLQKNEHDLVYLTKI